MIVVKIYMWPFGDKSKERLLGQAAIDNRGVAREDDPERNIVRGERRYGVRIFKGERFGGPGDDVDVSGKQPKRTVWKEGTVRGHRPRAGRRSRGEWDLVGGALKVLLGNRLDDYTEDDSGAA